MSNILELRNINKRFKDFSLKDVSFYLPKGFIMGFIGPNGAGKTTVIKLMLNILTPDAGSIDIFGKSNIIFEREIKSKIGIVMDSPYYVDEWNLKDIEKALMPFYKSWDSSKYNRLLKDFNLDAKKRVKELSRGMKMKLMIAVSLSHEAKLLILDEPTSGLDAVARDELMDILIKFISDENKGVLFSTHITSDLEKIADYITFINNGRIILNGKKDDLMERYVLIKGGSEALKKEESDMIIGYEKNSLGFSGLIEKKLLERMPGSVIFEPCSLDDIVIRFNKGGVGI